MPQLIRITDMNILPTGSEEQDVLQYGNTCIQDENCYLIMTIPVKAEPERPDKTQINFFLIERYNSYLIHN